METDIIAELVIQFPVAGAILITVVLFTNKIGKQLARIHERLDSMDRHIAQQSDKMLELTRELLAQAKRNGHS